MTQINVAQLPRQEGLETGHAALTQTFHQDNVQLTVGDVEARQHIALVEWQGGFP